jgi:glycosyltransferase involved in cell wall biosynthesis
MPRICIEASPALQQQAGLGRYTAGLLHGLLELEPQADYALAYNLSRQVEVPRDLAHLPRYAFPHGNKPWRLRNAASYFGALAMDLDFAGSHLYHSTGHLLPRLRTMRTVFTLHDVIPFLFPEHHLWQNKIFFEIMLPRFLRQADAIIAVSRNTKRDALRVLNLPPEKIHVIPEGVDARFAPVTDPQQLAAVRQRYNLPQRFVLTVGTLEPRKNHTMLLHAFGALLAAEPDVVLAIAGKHGWLYRDFLTALENSGLEPHVRLLDRVPDADLPALLSAASVFAFPSLYEGFGLPPLEAMACGAPVLCSTAASLPEVVGEGGWLLNPLTPAEWTRAMQRLLSEPDARQTLIERAHKQAAGFSWRKTAIATRAVYHHLLRSEPERSAGATP